MPLPRPNIKTFFKNIGVNIVKSVVKIIVNSVHIITTTSGSKLLVRVLYAASSISFIKAQALEISSSSTADQTESGSSTGNFENSTAHANSSQALSCVNNAIFMDRNYAYMADPRELTAYGDYLSLYAETGVSQYFRGASDALVGGNNNDGHGPLQGCVDDQGYYQSDTCQQFVEAFHRLRDFFFHNATGNPMQMLESTVPTFRFRVQQFSRMILQEGNETHSQIEEVNRNIYTPSRTQVVRTTLHLLPPNLDGSNGSHIESEYIDPETNEGINVVTERRYPASFLATPQNDTAVILEATPGEDILVGQRYNLSSVFNSRR